MIKFTRLLAFAAMLFISSEVFAWDGHSSDISWFSSSKTEYHIANAEQLKGLSDLVLVGNDFEGKTIILDNDIDLGYSSWQPIGGNTYNAARFNGIFDGQNHKIKAVHPALSEDSYYPLKTYGLFGSVGEQSIIKNLSITGGSQIAPASNDNTICAGGIAGESYGTIENVQVEFSITASDKSYNDIANLYVGGVCGKGNSIVKAKSSGTIGFAYANVQWRISDLSGTAGFGGIAGQAKEIKIAQSNSEISAWGKNMTFVGGIVGKMQDGSVENTCFYGKLSIVKDIWYNPSAFLTGCSGIIGGGFGGNTLSVSNCISAPSNYNVQVSAIYLAPIVGDSNSNNWTGNNNYYTLPPTVSDNLGQATTEGFLCKGNVLDGFDNNIWDFPNGELPSLKDLQWQNTTSISNVEQKQLPQFSINQNEVTITNIEPNTRFTVYNVQGSKVLSEKINPNESITLLNGTYIIKLGNSTYKIAICR